MKVAMRDYIVIVRLSDKTVVRVIESAIVTLENVRELAKKMSERLAEFPEYRLPEYDILTVRCEDRKRLRKELSTLHGFQEAEVEIAS